MRSKLIKAKFILTMSLVCMLSLMPLSSFAADRTETVKSNVGIMPLWVGIEKVNSSLTITNGKANITALATRSSSNISKVAFSGSLQQNKNGTWTTVYSWSGDGKLSNSDFTYSTSSTVQKGYNYRVTCTAKAYNGSTLVDTIQVTSQTVSY